MTQIYDAFLDHSLNSRAIECDATISLFFFRSLADHVEYKQFCSYTRIWDARLINVRIYWLAYLHREQPAER